MKWEVPKEIDRATTWTVITYEDFHVVIPTTDIKPHEVESTTCPCKPTIEMEGDFTFIHHNSWRDQEAIEASLKNLF